jgi:hypothetical protein
VLSNSDKNNHVCTGAVCPVCHPQSILSYPSVFLPIDDYRELRRLTQWVQDAPDFVDFTDGSWLRITSQLSSIWGKTRTEELHQVWIGTDDSCLYLEANNAVSGEIHVFKLYPAVTKD